MTTDNIPSRYHEALRATSPFESFSLQVLPGARCRLPRLAPAFNGNLGALVHLLLYCDQSVHKRSLQPLALFRSEAVSFLSRTDRPLSQRSSELSQPHRPPNILATRE